MDEKYVAVARERILGDIGFESQKTTFDLVGRILSLEGHPLVNELDFEFYGLDNDYPQKIKSPIKFDIKVGLDESLLKEDHDVVMGKVKRLLEDRKIDSSQLFSYCSHSYGIEDIENLDFWIGVYK